MDNKMKVFDVDAYRTKLATAGDFDELAKTYSGEYPEISDISTADKWDALSSGVENVPAVRVHRLEKVVSAIDVNKKIVDIGAGWGDIVPILLKHKKDIDYTGIDFSTEIIKNLCNRYPGQKFINVAVDGLEGDYDYVLVLEVLEHVVPTKIFGFLKEVKRVLKRDGTLIITVPLGENLKETTFICGKCKGFVNRMGHVRSYTLELISAELELAGFCVNRKEFIFDGYYGFKGKIKRYLRNIAGHFLGPAGFKPVGPCGVILECSNK